MAKHYLKLKRKKCITKWFNSECVIMKEYTEKSREARKSRDVKLYKELKNIIQRESRKMENEFWDKIADKLLMLEKQSDTKAYYEALKMVYVVQVKACLRECYGRMEPL